MPAAAIDEKCKLRTLVVDDQEDVRTLLRMVIDRANRGMCVVGEAATGPEALDKVERFDPVVVVLDEMMPHMSGLETAAELKARTPSPVIILCSAYLDANVIARAREIGIDAWISKDEIRDLPSLIRSVAS